MPISSWTCQGLITHQYPDVDEWFSAWALQQFGEFKYPGVSTAPVIVWNTGGNTPDGRTAEQWEADGCLLLGIGKGRFDEHHDGRGNGQPGECTASLVAKDLGILRMPELKHLLAYVVSNDTTGQSSPFDLAQTVKVLNRTQDLARVKEIVFAIFDGFFQKAVGFQEAIAEVEGKVQLANVGKGKWVIASIESDNDQIGAAVRYRHHQATVVVIRHSAGATEVLLNQKSGLKIGCQLAGELRRWEQIAQGRPAIKPDRLELEGGLPECPEWFFYKPTQGIFSRYALTGLSVARIVAIAGQVLSETAKANAA